MPPLRARLGALLALVVVGWPATAPALEILFDYQYDESGFFDDPERRAVLERAARQYTRAIDADLGDMSWGEWAAVFPDPGRAGRVVYRDLAVPRDTVRIFVGARPRGAEGAASGVPGYAAWRCVDPRIPDTCSSPSVEDSEEARQDWLQRHVFRSRPSAAAWPPRSFTPWGGALSFASDITWYSGIDQPVPPGQLDLLSAAVHELGHILGVGMSPVWAARAAGDPLDGPHMRIETECGVPLTGDGLHLAPETRGRLDGEAALAAFAAGLDHGERRELTALDEAVLRDLGWTRGEGEARESAVVIKGDLDGDRRVDWVDLILLENYLQDRAAESSTSTVAVHSAWREAADVAPMVDGDARGDGHLDDADLAVLRAAVEQRDVDGDGIPTVEENDANASSVFVAYHPLQRWPDACSAPRKGVLGLLGPTERRVPWCLRDGSPAFELPVTDLAPGEARRLEESLTLSSRGPRGRPGEGWKTIPFRSWSPSPAVSPELYLEIVEAEQLTTKLASEPSSEDSPKDSGDKLPLVPPPAAGPRGIAPVGASQRGSPPAYLAPAPARARSQPPAGKSPIDPSAASTPDAPRQPLIEPARGPEHICASEGEPQSITLAFEGTRPPTAAETEAMAPVLHRRTRQPELAVRSPARRPSGLASEDAREGASPRSGLAGLIDRLIELWDRLKAAFGDD